MIKQPVATAGQTSRFQSVFTDFDAVAERTHPVTHDHSVERTETQRRFGHELHMEHTVVVDIWMKLLFRSNEFGIKLHMNIFLL